MAAPAAKRLRGDDGDALPLPAEAAAAVSAAMELHTAATRRGMEDAMRSVFGERERQLDAREKDLADRERAMEELQRKMRDAAARQDDRIRLDIRGQKYSATRASLAYEEGTFFAAMLGDGWAPDSSGEYFIDRNPAYAIPVLEYLVKCAQAGGSTPSLRKGCRDYAKKLGQDSGDADDWKTKFKDDLKFYNVDLGRIMELQTHEDPRSQPQQVSASSEVLLSQLPLDWEDEEILSVLETVGPVVKLTLFETHRYGAAYGYSASQRDTALCEYRSSFVAQQAVNQLDGAKLGNTMIRVQCHDGQRIQGPYGYRFR